MEKKSPQEVVKDSIEMLPVMFDQKNESSEFAFNLIMGRIAGFVEIGSMTNEEMDYFIDYALQKHNQLG